MDGASHSRRLNASRISHARLAAGGAGVRDTARVHATRLGGGLATLATLWLLIGPSFGQDAKSVVYIKCDGADGKTSRGSGVIVSDRGRVLTAKHVAPPGYQCKGVIGTAAEEPTRKLLRRKTSADYDAMLLEFVPNANERFHSVFALKLEPELQGRDIAAFGFPATGTGQVSVRTGSISTTIPSEEGTIETDALTTRGMSGGPVFLKGSDDALVGIVAGASFDPGTGLPTDFAVLAAEIVAKDFDMVAGGADGPSSVPRTEGNGEAEGGAVPVTPGLKKLVGSWSGEAVEPGGSKFTIQMGFLPGCTLDGACGTIAVPHVPCHGRLTLIRQTKDDYEFSVDQFDDASDLSVCTPGAGEIVRPLANGTLDYSASYSGAHAILRRVKAP